MITKPTLAGAFVAAAGHGLALVVTMVVAIAAGGGPDADLDSGEKAGVLMVSAATFTIAQSAVLGACIASRQRLGPQSSHGLALGWLLGMAATVLYLCGGLRG